MFFNQDFHASGEIKKSCLKRKSALKQRFLLDLLFCPIAHKFVLVEGFWMLDFRLA